MHTVQYRTLVANVSEMSFSSVALYNMQLFCIYSVSQETSLLMSHMACLMTCTRSSIRPSLHYCASSASRKRPDFLMVGTFSRPVEQCCLDLCFC